MSVRWRGIVPIVFVLLLGAGPGTIEPTRTALSSTVAQILPTPRPVPSMETPVTCAGQISSSVRRPIAQDR
jgi:hypothetical protein